jgi:periplasmic divalent cation tolerance protein
VTPEDGGAAEPALVVLTTESDREAAHRLATALVEARVAACVGMYPIDSIYRWEGTVREDGEVQLVIKTTPEAVDGLVSAIAEHHSYDVPEMVVLDARTSAGYGTWMRDEVG